MTKFSIFLPVRNGWPYVKECIESILQQTYPHFELHVLDNQSTDNTISYLRSLNDARLRLWTSTSALSIEDSWARVKNVPKQEYMTLIGHDDILDAGFLDAIKVLIDRYPDASLYQTGSRLINAGGKKIRSCRSVPQTETAAGYMDARFAFQRDIFGTGYVMRSSDYDRLGGIPAFEKLFFADDALWLALMHNSYKAADPRETFAVRIHAKSESASLPSAWSSILLGLNQFTEFLHRYVKDDDAARSVLEERGARFLLTYHQNIYIFALIDACQNRKKVGQHVLRSIESSLARIAPRVAGDLRRSLKVRLLEFLNASLLRGQVTRLWSVYYVLKTRSV